MQVLEKSIESRFAELMQRAGVVSVKMNLQGRRGWPDRLCVLPRGRTVFIEFKQPGEEPRKLQLHIHGLLRELNHDVQVFDDAEAAASYVLRAMDA